jgi:hypothetical protein
VLTLLLTSDAGEWASVAQMARATGYTVAAVRKAIGDLAESRLIDAIAGTRAEYRATRPRWQALLGMAALPGWRHWQERYVFVATFLAWAADAEHRHLTPYVFASRGRDLVEAHAAAFQWPGDEDWPAQLMAIEENPLLPAIHRLAGWMEMNV